MSFKKILAIITAAVMAFIMVACSGKAGDDLQNEGNDVKNEAGTEQSARQKNETGHALIQNMMTGEEFYIDISYDSRVATPVGMDYEFTVHGGGKIGLGGMVAWAQGSTPADCMAKNRNGRVEDIHTVVVDDGQIFTTHFDTMEVHYFGYTEPQYHEDLIYEFAFALPEGKVVSGTVRLADHNADFSAVINDVILRIKLAE